VLLLVQAATPTARRGASTAFRPERVYALSTT
jgi:hypothetical protein